MYHRSHGQGGLHVGGSRSSDLHPGGGGLHLGQGGLHPGEGGLHLGGFGQTPPPHNDI